ncbi:hypothetical protein A3L09_10280 [Thermococcus profundus]|uniref:Uncharacterized protein n=1 Tax=Thermococcus profundus TaxID=49899 RepID=A0A2Z2MNY8_THEPR|nr:hypothetical protein A3L09_10280 [Thermococcus profundus]
MLPGTFFKPVNAAPQIQIESTDFYLGAFGSNQVSNPFVGYPANLSVNVSGDYNYNFQVLVYYNESGQLVLKTQSGLINLGDDLWEVVNLTLPEIPKNASEVIVSAQVIAIIGGEISVAYETTKHIPVKESPVEDYNDINIVSSVPYWDGSAWQNNAAFKNIPFNLTLQVDFNDTLVAGYGSLLPNETELKAYLYAGSDKIATGVVNTTLAVSPNDYFINFTNVKSTNISYLTLVLEDTKHGLTYTIPLNETGKVVEVHNWWLNVTSAISGSWDNSLGNTAVVKFAPFNVTFTITSNSSLGKLGLDATGTFQLEGASEATPMSGTFNLTDGTNTTTIYNVSADPLVVTFSLPDYGVSRTVTINVYDWQINVDADIYIYDNTSNTLTSSDYGYGFYKDIPATMLVKFNYTNSTLPGHLVLINSTATVEVYYGDDLIWVNNSVPVVNGQGQIFVNLTNVSFVAHDATKKIRVVVKDNNYAKWGDKKINVYDWGINAWHDYYYIYTFGKPPATNHFYVDIPANFTFWVNFEKAVVTTVPIYDDCGCVIGYKNVTYLSGDLPFVPQTQLNVTVSGPGFTKSYLLNVTDVLDLYAISELIKFNAEGKVKVTITDTVYGRSDIFYIYVAPIESDFGAHTVYNLGNNLAHCTHINSGQFVDHIPANLTYDIEVDFPIDEAYVNVTFTGPDGTVYGPFEYYVNTTNGGLTSGSISYVHLNVSDFMQFNKSGYVKAEWTMLIFANGSTYNTTISGYDKHAIFVQDWPNVDAYVHYNVFYIGVMDDLHVFGEDSFPFPVNANLSVHVTGPNYDKWINETFTYEDVCSDGPDFNDMFNEILEDLQFNETGYVTVDWSITYWDDTLNISPFTYAGVEKFPVKKWYVSAEPTPDSLTVGQDAIIGVNIGVYPDDSRLRYRTYNVTIELPNGQKFWKLATGDYRKDFDVYFEIPGEDITVPGVAKITVSDVGSDGLVKTVQYIPVFPNIEYNKKYIDVKVTPDEIYQYQTGTYTIDLQYMGVSGNVIYPIDADSMVNVTVYVGGEIAYSQIVPMHNNNGHATITGIKLDATGPITVEVKDLTDPTIAGVATVNVKPWKVDVTFEPEKVYKYIPVNLSVVATPNVTAISPDDLEIYVNGELYTESFPEVVLTEDTNYTVTVYYVSDLGNKYLMYNETYTVDVLDWGIEVDTHPLYVHPQFENSLVFPFTYVDENGDTVPFTGTANVTLVLPDGQNFTGTFDVVNGEGTIDFGKTVINQTGNATLTVVQVIGAYNVTKTVKIPVDELVKIVKVEPTTIYAGIPTEVKVYVHSGANDYENITVTLDGTELTYIGDGVYAADVTLEAGNYTITVYDAVYNVTDTEDITVEGWHLVMSADPDSFPAATLRTITITVKAVLDRNESITAQIDDTFTGEAVFNNTDLYPIKTSFTVEMTNGVGSTNIQLYAPDIGKYFISGEDKYGKTAELELPVTEPDMSKLAWVYTSIKKEGSLESPNETTVIYVAFNNREGPYVPAYDFVNHKQVVGTTEAVFPLAPVEEFKLYVIAVPLEIAKDVPVIEDISTFAKTWNVTKIYKNVTPEVEQIDQTTWSITVNVDGNITTFTYTYKPPMAPGAIPIEPQASSVWGNAIYTKVTKEIAQVTPLEGFSEIIQLTPTLEIERVTDMDIQPAKEGSYFDFKAILYVENAKDQFDQQFQEKIVPQIQAWTFLTDDEKENLINEIYAMAGNISAANGPLANKLLQFNVDSDIAYVEPTNATTDENGIATFKVYSAAKTGMTPDELLTLMGDVNVYATYDGIMSNVETVRFGGIGSVAGIVMDENNNPVAGVKVVVYTFNGTEWVPAVDYAGNELSVTTDAHGHYEIDGIPALPPLSVYRVVAFMGNTPAGFAEVGVSPFQTSPANIVVGYTEAPQGLAAFVHDVQTGNAKIVLGENALTSVDYQAMSFIFDLVGVKPTYTPSTLSIESGDVIIAVGGPEANSITAQYQEIAPVKMVTENGTISIVVDNETVANWTAPAVWWNVSKGYWVIQKVVDPDTGATVYMIYGTDADSTWAAAYYFSQHFSELHGNYVVGYWEETDGLIYSPAFLQFASDDNNGFSPGDNIGVIIEG